MGVTVKQILVTHAHFDHFLAAEELRSILHCPVLLHQADLMLWRALPLQMMMMGMASTSKKIADPDQFIEEGMKLHVRGGVAIHTPGHRSAQ